MAMLTWEHVLSNIPIETCNTNFFLDKCRTNQELIVNDQ